MTTFKYKVYYEYDGPSKAAPLRQKKNQDEIDEALERVEFELSIFLDDDNSSISVTPESPTSLILEVATSKREEIFNMALTKCLGGLDLCGEKL